MKFYRTNISEKFHAPKNVGKAASANAVGTSATFVCGAILRLTLRIETNTKEILDARFQTNGCGFLIASADVLTEKIIGKRLVELHGLDKQTLQTEIENELGIFENHRRHCLDLTFDALQNSFADFRAGQIEEFAGEKALICTCFGISEETIEQLIKKKSLKTIEEITNVCNAGGGCGSCQPLIQEIIDTVWREEI
ncbi:MAG: iron-sulfur cluster assembly scaffold protein [Acidobacteria bacterium]|jgi:NifU-like protein|nr:iron-sulfur cluster assembly scaffold protein [Acidobacteriota bacterium]MBA3783947.1 iron-sulfur cluster assembly scaffold protein [Acidobacteriota bacterium]MBA4122610.1 iron-sulfur cluster assembly scaffold protein [Acidobacteriota bacterium]MBA4182419.1 iron-sulfur cluster assembly scaffold protein [Acidobacteriota bacterium]